MDAGLYGGVAEAFPLEEGSRLSTVPSRESTAMYLQELEGSVYVFWRCGYDTVQAQGFQGAIRKVTYFNPSEGTMT